MNKIKELLPYIKPYAFAFFVAPVLIFAEAMAELVQPNLMAKIVNEGLALGNGDIVISSGIKMLLFAALGLICGVTSMAVSASASCGFGAALRLGIYRKIQTFSFFNIESFHTGSLITRLTNDTTMLQQMLQAMLRILIRAPLMLAGSIFMALHINRSLISVLLTLVPVLIVIIVSIFKKAFPLFMVTQKRLDRLNTVVQEGLSGVRVVKAFSGEEQEEKRFEAANKSLYDISLASNKIVILLIPLLMLAMNFGTIAVIGMGGLKVQYGALAIGDIMAYTNYLANILQALMIMSFVLMTFSRSEASLTRIVEILQTNPDIVSPDRAALIPANSTNSTKVAFQDVYFSYNPGNLRDGTPPLEERFVLNGLTFSLQKDLTLGIIGSTGSGKSTLISLIPRLYDATRGVVRLDGRDVKSMPLEELRKKIGLIMQDSILFSGTIEENIRWGKPDATDKEVYEAARFAEADSFIRSFRDGYNTVIGQRGVDLSGGQKQRLCIARTLIGRPEILIFDDCTSAVDFGTEARIRHNMAELSATKIIVAQRVGSIINADEIIVLEKGLIVERGTHKDLWAKGTKNGVYRAICDSQPGTAPEDNAAGVSL